MPLSREEELDESAVCALREVRDEAAMGSKGIVVGRASATETREETKTATRMISSYWDWENGSSEIGW